MFKINHYLTNKISNMSMRKLMRDSRNKLIIFGER